MWGRIQSDNNSNCGLQNSLIHNTLCWGWGKIIGVKKLIFFLLQNFGFWFIRKVNKFQINTWMPFSAIANSARGGPQRPPPHGR